MKTIREWRQDLGWTQFELAVKVGVRPQTVYFWESGRRTPQVAQMRTLGRLFGICSDAIALVTHGAPVNSHQAEQESAPQHPPPAKRG